MNITIAVLSALAAALVLAGCGQAAAPKGDGGGSGKGKGSKSGVGADWIAGHSSRGNTADDRLFTAALKTMTVTSSGFAAGGTIPREFTRYGDDTSPPLAWSGAPDGTQGFAIILDDPDAPPRVWLHWTAWNIPAGMTALEAGVQPDDGRFVQGRNDYGSGSIGYGGPQPPAGTGPHRYRFHVAALSQPLDLQAGAPLKDLLAALKGKVLAWGMLVGTHEKKK